jgi:hypothetical protein
MPSLVNLKESVDDGADLLAHALIDQLLSNIDDDEGCVDVQAYLLALRGRLAGPVAMEAESTKAFVYEVALRMCGYDGEYLEYIVDWTMDNSVITYYLDKEQLYEIKYDPVTRKPDPKTGRSHARLLARQVGRVRKASWV